MNKIKLYSPAKLNIGLRVISERSDGYHNIETLFYPVSDLFDILTFEISSEFEFVCNNKAIQNHNNLIVKTVKKLEEYTDEKLNVTINCLKRIPLGGGLGGGSSDAATTILALDNLFDLDLNDTEMLDIALEIGSDVPYFLNPIPSIGTKRGEELSETDFILSKPVLIVNPGIEVSTKEAFTSVKPFGTVTGFTKKIEDEMRNPEEWKNYVINDFEKSIFERYPQISAIKQNLYSLGASFALMSGTGSTVFGIFNSFDEAVNAEKEFSPEYFTFILL